MKSTGLQEKRLYFLESFLSIYCSFHWYVDELVPCSGPTTWWSLAICFFPAAFKKGKRKEEKAEKRVTNPHAFSHGGRRRACACLSMISTAVDERATIPSSDFSY